MRVISIFKQGSSFYLSFILGVVISFTYTNFSTLNNGCFSLDYYSPELSPFPGRSSEEFRPRVNLAGKPQKAKKVPQNLVRPRYYSSELGIREKLLVGILTRQETVGTLAVALNKTSSHLVNKLMFFMDAAGAEKANVISLKLPGIVGFVDTRDLLKPFHTLKYLTDNFLEEYDFFFLARDTSYVNARALLEVVNKISVSFEVHMGGARLKDSISYCSLDGGILLSNSVLKKIQGSLDWCVKNAFSDLDDENVGRCILHACQIPCKTAFQDLKMKSEELAESDKVNLPERIKEPAVTYYKMLNPNNFYNLHLALTKLYLERENTKINKLKSELDTSDLAWPPGSYPPKTPANRFDLLHWEYFDSKKIYLTSDFSNSQHLAGPHLIDINNVMNRSVEWVSKNYGGKLRYSRLVNGYRRFDPSRGLDYILDLAFNDDSGREVIKRLEVTKRLGRTEMLPMPYVTESSRVFIIVPLSDGDRAQATSLMSRYVQLCSQADPSFLILVLLYEPNAPGKGHEADVFKNIKDLSLKLSAKYHRDCKITWISIRVPDVGGGPPIMDHLLDFAILDLASKKLAPESLVFLTEPNMELRGEFINRVRMMTVLGKQVYSPIPFTEFPPAIAYRNAEKKPSLEIHKNTGRFDTDNTRHISFYLSDYLEYRGKEKDLIMVRADRDITELFRGDSAAQRRSLLTVFAESGMSVVRSPDPALRLQRRACPTPEPPRLRPSQYYPCRAPLGTRAQLAQLILDLRAAASPVNTKARLYN